MLARGGRPRLACTERPARTAPSRSQAATLPGASPGARLARYDRGVRSRLNTGSSKSSNERARRVEAEEDRVLISQAKSGDAPAFRKLVERHQRRAFVIALGLVRD